MRISTTTLLSIVGITALSLTSCRQNIEWSQLTSFRIYQYKPFPNDKDIKEFTDTEIEKMNFIETDLEEAKTILNKSIPLGGKTYIWKGYQFAIATFNNGQTRKIKISNYGDFFMDLTNGQHYEFRGESKDQWDNFWSNNFDKLLQTK